MPAAGIDVELEDVNLAVAAPAEPVAAAAAGGAAGAAAASGDGDIDDEWADGGRPLAVPLVALVAGREAVELSLEEQVDAVVAAGLLSRGLAMRMALGPGRQGRAGRAPDGGSREDGQGRLGGRPVPAERPCCRGALGLSSSGPLC